MKNSNALGLINKDNKLNNCKSQVPKKELIDNEASKNVQDIQISEETMSLLVCRAKLCDIYNTVGNVVDNRYKKDIDEVFPGFSDAFSRFEGELMDVISGIIGSVSIESNHSKM